MLEITLAHCRATRALGQQLGEVVSAYGVVLLQGDLGAGKTTLVQGLAQGLGIAGPVVSPTFTLLNEYHEGRLPLYHFDLYRLDRDGVRSLNPDLYWDGEDVRPGVTVLEWSERLVTLPPAYLEIHLAHGPEDTRIAYLRPEGNLGRWWQMFQAHCDLSLVG